MSSLETNAIVLLIRSFGLPHRITGLVDKPGDHARDSRHYRLGTAGPGVDGQGLAVDVAGPLSYALDPFGAKAAMLRICEALQPHEHLFHELICSHLDFSVKSGQRGKKLAVNGHWNHIHVSVDKGVFVVPVPAEPLEVNVLPDDPNLPNITPPAKFYPVINTATGECTGYYIFSEATGEIHAHGPGAHFYGRSEVVAPSPR